MTIVAGCGRNTTEAPIYEPAAGRGDYDFDAPVGAIAGQPDNADEGDGPGDGGDKYDEIIENDFVRVDTAPLSTFSIDVDTASYSKVRQFLFDHRRRPRRDSVRIEELVNYFDYDYLPPSDDAEHPFATHTEVTQCPWTPANRLARIAIKGRTIEADARPAANLVFLVDSSGSMDQPNKLPLLVRGLQLLLENLNAKDRVAIVAYAGSAGLVLDSTSATQSDTILRALSRVEAGGSTNGGEGLELAYAVARDHFIDDGVNRILLCTDGDFNVGRTGTDQMLDLVEKESKAGIDLTVLGFGMGNFNDAMLEQISGRGNGNYAFIDTFNEARKVLQQQLSGTLVTIAKDVKIQVEFNPAEVAAYRLIGYENRMLESQDFNDDQKDAGEIGAGHAVTALYELIPAGSEAAESLPAVDKLKYQTAGQPSPAANSGELCTLKLRYKLPGNDTSTLTETPVRDEGRSFGDADKEFRFAAAVASFGMQLRESPHAGGWTLDTVRQTATSSAGDDPYGLRREFVEMVTTAKSL